MSAAFSFGSFGDIAALLQLAWQLRAALDDASGASATIKAVVADVDVFINALQNIQKAVERRRKSLRPDVLNGIGAALGQCRGTLLTVQQKIKRAEAQIAKGSSWQKHWGSAAWGILGGKKDVEALRKRLVEQVNLIQTYLSLLQAYDQDAILHEMSLQRVTLDRVYTVMQDIQMRFDSGIPTFRFYDTESGTYYAPFARTSLQQLCEIHTSWFTTVTSTDQIQSIHDKPWADVLESSAAEQVVQVRFCKWDLHFLFFRERAFGQWQALVGDGTGRCLSPHYIALKELLERKRRIDASHNCELITNQN